MTEIAADRDAVLAALDRITAWSEMARSPQLTRFLDYIVRKRLDGDTQSVKAYSIAVDVFGRPANFDPQSDPIVRVQARRLRALLDQYYRGPGEKEELQIHLPVGRYVPDFIITPADAAVVTPTQKRPMTGLIEPEIELALGEAATAKRPRGHVTVSWFVLLVIAIGIAALAYSLSTWEPRFQRQAASENGPQLPSIRIMDFQNLTGDATLTSAISALAIEVVTDFTPFSLVNASYGGQGEVSPEQGTGSRFVLTGIVRSDSANDSQISISAILTEVATNTVVWNWSRPMQRAEFMRIEGIEALSLDLVSMVGGVRGPLHNGARQMALQGDIAGKENTYLCILLFSIYRAVPSVNSAGRVQECLDGHPEKNDPPALYLAEQASLIAETIDTGRVTTATRMERFGRANELLTRALTLAPTSSFVWEQRARLHEALGAHDQAEGAYGTALQLNPANLDALAAHARHIALMGRLDDAIPMARRAISAVPADGIPTWYQCVPALAEFRQAQYLAALRHAEICAQGDIELGGVLTILVAQAIGDNDTVTRYLSRVLEIPSFRNVGILNQLRRKIPDLELVDRVRVGLTAAGVPPMSLVSPY